MKTKKRQKMCYNCEGEIDLDVIVCPFCAADLREEKPEQHPQNLRPAPNLNHLNTQQSLYPTQNRHPAPNEEPSEEEEEPEEEEEQEGGRMIAPTILLSLGAQLFLLSLFMLLFSKEGSLVLKWDARLWYLYLFSSAPLLIFGYRMISRK